MSIPSDLKTFLETYDWAQLKVDLSNLAPLPDMSGSAPGFDTVARVAPSMKQGTLGSGAAQLRLTLDRSGRDNKLEITIRVKST